MQADRSGAPLTIGIDLGTQSVRVVLVEEDGAVVASGSAPLSGIHTYRACHEQDPRAWWEAVGEAARKVSGKLRGREVSGLAVCSTSGTFLLADKEGRSLTPALMYNDGRAQEETRLAQEAGEEVWTSLGTSIQSSFALPKLLLLVRSGLPKGTARVMHQADYIASRLAGEMVATDWSHALKTGYDLINGRWPEEVFEWLKVPVEILPPVVRPGSTIGEISGSGAAHTGFPAGTPIRAGMTDGCAAQIAGGALQEGQWNSVLGTTLALKGVTRELLSDPTGAVYSHKHPDGGWLPGGASNTGAGILSERFPKSDLGELDEAAERHGPSTMAMYPLTIEGERFPFANTEARGFDLGEPEDQVDLYRAILEGVAFVERLCFAHLGALGAEISGPVALTGGGAKSRVWSQLRADVLGLPVVVPRFSEGAVGMAILARAGDGPVAEAAAGMSEAVARYEPESRDGRLVENFDRLATALVEREYISEELADRARMS